MRNVETFVDGSEIRPSPPLPLQAGPLSMLFEPETVFLRRIRWGNIEVIRGLYAAVRDRNWDTIHPRIENLQVESSGDSFHLSFGVSCQRRGIDFYWNGTIFGTPEGAVEFQFDGRANSDFLRNRIGFCVLHPIKECGGQACELERVGGSTVPGVFPTFISPNQPFRNLQAITHEVKPGLKAQLRFQGDIFETEDQRNWTDASFKTYCTPLDQPFPAPVRAGDRIQQSVKLSLIPPPPSGELVFTADLQNPQSQEVIAISSSPTFLLPSIGLGLASHGQPLRQTEIKRLRALALSHLRADLHFSVPNWKATLKRAAAESAAIDSSLHLALFLTDQAEHELHLLLTELKTLHARISLWLIYHVNEASTSARWVRLAEQVLGQYQPTPVIAAGTNSHFTELNRNRPTEDTRALPCFSITPQVHAFDNTSIMENLEAQRATVQTIRQFSRHPVAISPITLRPRGHAEASEDSEIQKTNALPPTVDRRQLSLFAAAWTLGSLVEFASGDAIHSLTYFETTGWRGLMETEAGSPLPSQFPSLPGTVFPMYFVFASLAGFRECLKISKSGSREVAVLGLSNKAVGCRILVANLANKSTTVRLRISAEAVSIQKLDETNIDRLFKAPEKFCGTSEPATAIVDDVLTLSLKRYGVARIEVPISST